jgi:hypothetical protein
MTMTVAENGGGGVAVTVLAASTNYYLTSSTASLTAIGTALTASASLAGTYTATVSDDDSGTGKVTIAVSGGGVTSFAITWTNTSLRDYLGFTTDVSGTTTYTGASSSPYIYLPNQKRSEPIVPQGYKGMPVTDATVTISPNGYSHAAYYATRYANQLIYRYMSGPKTWRSFEATTNESLQSFYETVIGKGKPVRYHHDRDDDATYVTWRLMPMWAVRPEIPGFVGRGTSGSSTLWSYGPIDAVEFLE